MNAAFLVVAGPPIGCKTPPPPIGREDVEAALDEERVLLRFFSDDLIFLRVSRSPPAVPKRKSPESDRLRLLRFFLGVSAVDLVSFESLIGFAGLVILPRGKFTSSAMVVLVSCDRFCLTFSVHWWMNLNGEWMELPFRLSVGRTDAIDPFRMTESDCFESVIFRTQDAS